MFVHLVFTFFDFPKFEKNKIIPNDTVFLFICQLFLLQWGKIQCTRTCNCRYSHDKLSKAICNSAASISVYINVSIFSQNSTNKERVSCC